jgi:hypothetical protein
MLRVHMATYRDTRREQEMCDHDARTCVVTATTAKSAVDDFASTTTAPLSAIGGEENATGVADWKMHACRSVSKRTRQYRSVVVTHPRYRICHSCCNATAASNVNSCTWKCRRLRSRCEWRAADNVVGTGTLVGLARALQNRRAVRRIGTEGLGVV